MRSTNQMPSRLISCFLFTQQPLRFTSIAQHTFCLGHAILWADSFCFNIQQARPIVSLSTFGRRSLNSQGLSCDKSHMAVKRAITKTMFLSKSPIFLQQNAAYYGLLRATQNNWYILKYVIYGPVVFYPISPRPTTYMLHKKFPHQLLNVVIGWSLL